MIAGALLSASVANAATITFGNTVNDPFLPTETYVEQGFQFTVVSGSQWEISSVVGNPPSALSEGAGAAGSIGNTISVVRVGGGLFTFASVDFSSWAGALSDGVDLIGLVGGNPIQSLTGLDSSQFAFQTQNSGFTLPIDELRITISSIGDFGLSLDNFVLNDAAIPEPASIVLLGAALAGLAAGRRRKIA